MLLGVRITREVLLAGGGVVLALIVFQLLQGKRKIKFKGRLHQKVHRYTAYAIAVVAVVHALTALAYLRII